ncbi:hypothetical protein K2X33_06195 [bacterium]|nr:hypothetical protein [bacterium]
MQTVKTLFSKLRTAQAPLIVVAMLLLPACQKRCQQSATTAFKSVVDSQWRLAHTDDPQVAPNLDNFNFLIVTFNRNNTGQVNRVVDNDQYTTPVQTIVWQPNSAQRLIRIQYSSVANSPDSGTATQSGATPGDMGTFDYQYKLGTTLTMRDVNRGYTYYYVPMMGTVDPDSTCTF